MAVIAVGIKHHAIWDVVAFYRLPIGTCLNLARSPATRIDLGAGVCPILLLLHMPAASMLADLVAATCRLD